MEKKEGLKNKLKVIFFKCILHQLDFCKVYNQIKYMLL